MNKTILCVLGLLSQAALAQTADPFQTAPVADLRPHAGSRWDAAVATLPALRERPARSLPAQVDAAPASPLALAIGRAAKKGVIELGVDGYTDILIQCQKAQSVVLTTPLLRSDAQQAHCYRF